MNSKCLLAENMKLYLTIRLYIVNDSLMDSLNSHDDMIIMPIDRII